MIDWINLAINSLWIIALALALAVLSFARWESRKSEQSLKAQLNLPRWSIPLNIAGILFCLGLAATSDAWWERVIWVILSLMYVYQIWLMKRK